MRDTMYSHELNRADHLCVCEHCLWGIESHEGQHPTMTIWCDEDDPIDSKCDWCEESGFDTLYAFI